MPDIQQQNPSLASLNTVEQARAELEVRLNSIHNDLQLTQTIGLLFVKRQEDLKNCFDQLQLLKDSDPHSTSSTLSLHLEYEHDSIGDSFPLSAPQHQQPLPQSLREQLALIDKEFQEGHNGILGLKGMIDAQLPTIAIQPPQGESVSRSGSGILGPSALPSSVLPVQTITKPRRHKVVVPLAPSINDPAFPVQIQEELLNQVRYWTSQAEMKEKLNQEYDTKITEQERIIDALQKQRRMREESDERLKEDQWNLELLNQDLRAQNLELQQQLSRAQHENTKVQRALTSASEQVEQLKDREERAAGQLETTKSRHEQDMTTMRKHAATIQREKSDLTKRVEELTSSLTQQQQKLAKIATMEAIALAQEQEEQESESPVEAPVVIMAPTRLPAQEDNYSNAATQLEPRVSSIARETSFAHQQSIISELQSKLGQEVTDKEELVAAKESLLAEKEELVKMLADREETIETLRLEGTLPVSTKSSPLQTQTISRRLSGVGMQKQHRGQDENEEMSGGARVSEPLSVLSGGLFAELAQASSSTESAKPVLEYRDQETTTDPIESWIRHFPGFASVPKLDDATGAVSLTFEDNIVSITTDSTSATAGPFEVDAATNTAGPIVTDGAVNITRTIETEGSADTTLTIEGNDVPDKTVPNEVDGTAETTGPIVTDGTIDTIRPTVADSTTNTTRPSVTDGTTNTIKPIVADSTTNTTKPIMTDSTTNTAKPIVMDSSTSTEDLQIVNQAASSQRHDLLTRIYTEQSRTDVKSGRASDHDLASTPTVIGLDVGALRAPEMRDRVQTGPQARDLAALDAFAHPVPPVVNLEDSESEMDEPVPRPALSNIPLNDDRRHTCDMSQSISDLPAHSIPPVPTVPKIAASPPPALSQSRSPMVERGGLFGSAFEDTTSSSDSTQTTTSLALPTSFTSSLPVDPTDERDHNRDDGQEHSTDHRLQPYQLQQAEPIGALSPGRPSTGPPSTLLARAASRTSLAHDLDTLSLNDVDTAFLKVSNSSAVSDPPRSLYSVEDISKPAPVHSGYPIRTSSIRSEQRLTSSSPPPLGLTPPPQSRSPRSTGAALISGPTRTAYTFSNSASQVHIPESLNLQQQQQQQQQQSQHLSDSSRAPSIGRRARYRPSPNGSMSSVSTDYGGQDYPRRLSVSSQYEDGAGGPRSASATADPTMIQVITQTMIGDYLWKYTRRPMASVISEKKHKRYFWVHPYTKTMYWSLNNPSAEGSKENRAKSALIMAVFQITDETPSVDPDVPNVSLLVQTPSRNLKLTAPTRQKHDLWFQSLAYLLSRPSTPGADVVSDNQTWSEVQATKSLNGSQMPSGGGGGGGGVASGSSGDALLTIRTDRSVRKKGSFNRFQTMFGRSKENSPAGSPGGAGGPTSSHPHQQQYTTSSSSLSGIAMAQPTRASELGYRSHHQQPQTLGALPGQMLGSRRSSIGGHGSVHERPMPQASSAFDTMTPSSSKFRMATGEAFDDEEDEYGYYEDGLQQPEGLSQQRLHYMHGEHGHGAEEMEGDEEEEDDEDEELPEHVRQCCDGKHDIGSLDHRH